MNAASHLEKLQKIALLREGWDPQRDFEMWYWSALTAGTNGYNALLHLAGLTPEEDAFSTIPGLYVTMGKDGQVRHALRAKGDVSHVDWPRVDGVKPPEVETIEECLRSLEQYRDPCIREGRQVTEAIVDQCRTAFETIVDVVGTSLGVRHAG